MINQPTALLEPAGGGGPPVNTIEFGLFAVVSFVLVGSRSVLVLVVPRGGGFVCPCCWFSFWCWFWSSDFGLGFGRVRWFRFIFAFVWRLVLVDEGQKLENSRCKLAVFK